MTNAENLRSLTENEMKSVFIAKGYSDEVAESLCAFVREYPPCGKSCGISDAATPAECEACKNGRCIMAVGIYGWLTEEYAMPFDTVLSERMALLREE